MKSNSIKYSIAAAFIAAAVIALYAINFHNEPISELPERWGVFGDYLGGTLNPILGFISILLLSRSIELQSKSHELSIKQQYEINKTIRNDSIRRARELATSIIATLTDNKSISIYTSHIETGGKKSISESISIAENLIDDMRSSDESKSKISEALDTIDHEDYIFEICRRLSSSLAIIEQELSDEAGHSSHERYCEARTIIRMITMHNIRLIILYINNQDNESTKYLKNSASLNKTWEESGLSELLEHLA